MWRFSRAALVTSACFLGGLGSGSGWAQDNGQCLEFSRALTLAVESAPEVDAAQAGIAEAEAVMREARSLRRPQVSSFSRSAVGDNGLTSSQIENQIGLRVSQRVIDFGDSRLAMAAARAGIDETVYAERAQRLQAAQTVAEAYLTRLEAEAMMDVISQRRAYFSRQKQAVDSLLAQAGATRAESAQIAAELAQAEADMLELEFSAERAVTRILEYTGHGGELCDADRLDSTVSQAVAGIGSVEDAVSSTLTGNPQIAAQRSAIRSLEASAAREDRSRLPVVELVGIVSYAYDDTREDWDTRDRLGVDVSIPLYSGDRIGARRDQARARLAGEEGVLRTQQRDLREQTEVTYRRQLSLQAQLIRREIVAENQFNYFDAIAGEFEFGLGTLPDLVDARLAYEQAALDVVATRFGLLREQVLLMYLTAHLPVALD